MTVRNADAVAKYAKHHSEMPAPDENGDIPNVDYGYTGDVERIHGLLKDASDVAYEMGE